MQCLTMIASFSGLVFFLNKNHREDMNKMDAKIDKMDSNHREDMKATKEEIKTINTKWDNLFNLFVELKLRNEK